MYRYVGFLNPLVTNNMSISSGPVCHLGPSHSRYWRLDRVHRSLAPKPPPRDIIVRFHYYESKKALTVATRNISQVDFKGTKIQIFNDLSSITLAKRHSFRPVTAYVQNHQITYHWGFPFCLSASKDGVQYSMRDLHESEVFILNLGHPSNPEEDLQRPTLTSRSLLTPEKIWTPAHHRKLPPPSKSHPIEIPHLKSFCCPLGYFTCIWTN